ncbi:MAG TPA: YkgJ family cysteine cluster protein [Armatimonadota bacterium]|jgi:Fe-S-cluster containining protein|nr:YkgJ family cysteine cluster protein [Armatimonadota bacterium]HPU00122.1 YkgJ family cysteine cluster protein [Armatimonadota bacterium]
MPDAPRPIPNAPRPARRVITDPATVEQRARDAARENVSFRAWLKFRCETSDPEVDALVRETTDQVWRHIDCIACAQCCRCLSITLDDRDIARLARRLHLSIKQFTRRYVEGTGDQRAFNQRPCPFLQSGACSVYSDRPQACRDFPYLHDPGFRHRMLGLLEFSLLCPVIYNTLELLKRRLPWRSRGGR